MWWKTANFDKKWLIMMQKYFLLCLITTGFFARVPETNAQSTFTQENSRLEPQHQIEFTENSEVNNLLISHLDITADKQA